ncbi:NACHT, LRR and PYD domains-containing protein 12 isoform X2 [Carassius auratus]|uniref:NACHT, LRR and PYD domains-containing protein 12 isoform X2 n=1 Tax=Carassius auratus TaxID=7957 RepID=A0A6P6JCU9_CARAU|nr:NACHT, LRR and PYD domains-containing protein 12-like isoform X2 [Carassius auratus]
MINTMYFTKTCRRRKSIWDEVSTALIADGGKSSLDDAMDFRKRRSVSPAPESSCVSMRSDASMDPPTNFSSGDSSAKQRKISNTRSVSPAPESSCVSMRSDASMDPPTNFSSGDSSAKRRKISNTRSVSPAPESSCVSMRSDASMDPPTNFSSGDSSAKRSNEQEGSKCLNDEILPDAVFRELEDTSISLMKKELRRFEKLLKPDCSASSVREEEEEEDEGQSRVSEAVLRIMLHVLRKMNQPDLANTLQTKLISVSQQQLKSRLKQKFQKISEGVSNQGNATLLNEIYTELYITEGGTGNTNNEHEVRCIETSLSRGLETQEPPIICNEIFRSLPGQDKPIRMVLTKGVAGIGKTASVHKFILDWAEGKANQDVHFIFPLPFRDLNLMKEKQMSLVELLCCFFTELKPIEYNDYKTIFIFDGLDEWRLPLDFQNSEILWDVTKSASVDVLLTNLIKGNLLPSALIWITARPAATNQIPAEFVDRVTEVQGFRNLQRAEYFLRKIKDHNLANRIVTHIQSTRSLHVMCRIPVFCWISATVLEKMLGEAKTTEIPKTLTQMFAHLLIVHTKLKTQKYDGKCEVDLKQARKSILSLGKLAFQQLERGNLVFYEEDLKQCDIDVREASMYSGVCTQIFKEEFGLKLDKVYSFVHLSVQEFFAALFKFLCFARKNKKSSMTGFLKHEVDRSLQSENGHLDLFLRFLLGLSLKSNQTLLRGLFTMARSSQDPCEIIEYIKSKIRENPSPEKSINLFHCLNELNDQSLVQEVQTYLSSRGTHRLSGVKLSPAQWSALVFVLLNSAEDLDKFELRQYDLSEECLLRLQPVVKASRKVDLRGCNLTDLICSVLASALSSISSSLRELDLSDNNLQVSGVQLLSVGLRSPHCKLETLKLCNCSIRKEGCAALVSALISNPSHLRELSLNSNKLGNSAVKLMSKLLEDPHCKLEKLQLYDCSIGEEGCVALALSLISNPSHLRELNLNNNEPGDSGVKLLSDLLKDPHCKLEKLQLDDNRVGEECFAVLVSSFISNPSHLRELSVSRNKPGDSGVRLLSDLLKDSNCKLEKLQLECCSIGQEGCAALALALTSNPSHLRELNLNYNEPGGLGVKHLSDLLRDSRCKLDKLKLECSGIGEENCAALVSSLISNPSHLRELNLSWNKPGDQGVQPLSDLLKNQDCKLEKLKLYDCSIGEEGCAALALALISNPSHLRELNLNNNDLGDSGVKLLSDLMKDPHCKLEKLQLEYCSIAKKGFAALVSGLKSNPSHLRELNLSRNETGDSGVKSLSDLLKHPQCELEKLELDDCSIGEEGFAALVSGLISNPSHIRELNLNSSKPVYSGVNLLCDLLRDQRCKLKKLQLECCGLGEEGCAALALALKSNPSHLRELNLNYNEPGDAGVKLLSILLMNPHCKLEKLELSHCSITESSCAVLRSALSSNPSHLRELNLNYNQNTQQ